MKRIAIAQPLEGHRVKLRFDDGVEGEVSLVALLDQPMFQSLRDPAVFSRLEVRRGRALQWPGGADLCADALYLEITGDQPETLFPGLRSEVSHA